MLESIRTQAAGVFDPDMTQAMVEAYASAMTAVSYEAGRYVHLPVHTLRHCLASRIIAAARTGETEAERLRDVALAGLLVSQDPPASH